MLHHVQSGRFLDNILVYWTSPEASIPLPPDAGAADLSAYIYLHDFHEANRTWQYRLINVLFFSHRRCGSRLCTSFVER